MITHIVFDMDGLLLDTEMIYFICYQRAARKWGKEFPFELFEQCVGMSPADSKQIIDNYYKGTVDVPALYQQTGKEFEDYLARDGEINFRPGAKEAVEYFANRGFTLAVASSNIRKWAEEMLQRKGIKKYFSVITMADDVTKTKPDPEIYLTTAARLNASPAQCLAFEDSVAGATAAIRAGLRTCVVPQIKQPDTFVRERAFKIYQSLDDIYPDMDELLG
ncbi:HAD family hydrolase [Candidatus Avelusimicrobium caledoniensis]|uniref:HAD family hydrolase n=1 Tax=Candidatus Avelusimicrobium caledoniensis TaxID=3416220 RepID=UPI003D0E12D9